MPVSYRIDGDVVTIRAVGTHTTDELRATWLASEADPAHPTPVTKLRICVDARDSESLATRSVAEMRDTAQWFEQRALALVEQLVGPLHRLDQCAVAAAAAG